MNGTGDEITIRTETDDIRSPMWWPDTSFLLHALSEGDASALMAAINMIGSDQEMVFASGQNTVSGELYARLEHLGYMAMEEDALPEDVQGLLVMRRFTDYGKKHVSDFTIAQKMQMEECGGDRSSLETFCEKFADLDDHHRGLPPETLHGFRYFFSDPRHAVEVQNPSNLYELYRILGIVDYTDTGLIHPTRFGALNVPFLFDLILHSRGAIARH
ncbi:hypothetical protein FMN50_26155 [Rhodobacterales bacterium]|nr:hypothetical protein FMN50_26155 [Rhodobacterales bacterium]